MLVVLSKLAPPLTGGRVVPRNGVEELLNGNEQVRLVLVTAPAGYGKTTSVATHFSSLRARGEAVGWLSLDAEDRDPSHFLSHFICALQTAQNGIGMAAQSLLSSGSSMPMSGILHTLCNEIGAARCRIRIVLDDFHRCECAEIVKLVDDLLEHAPEQFSLILTSRTTPNLRMLGRLRVQHRLSEVQVSQLRLEPAEATVFCNDILGLELSREQVMALYERTDGWAAGLQLVGLSLRDRADRDRFIHQFAGDHRDIVEYLAGEVLANLPEDTRAFLQQTSILGRMTASLCDAVTGQKNCAVRLAELERANMFLLPLDDQRTWYRYHHLFADYLRRSLEQGGGKGIAELHRRAYGWYARNGMIGEAIGHALEAGDLDQTAAFIESSWLEVIKMGRVRTLLAWIERLPEDLCDRYPQVRIALCWVLALRRESERALEQFRRARDAIQEMVQDGAGEPDHEALLAELRTSELFVHVFSDNEDEMVAAACEDHDTTVEYDPFVQGVHDNLLIYANLVAGEYDCARRCAVRARDRHMRADGVYGAVYSDCFRGLVEVNAGELDSACMLYERALRLATDRIGRMSVVAAMPAVLVTEVYYLLNEVDRARANLEEMLHLVDECAILDAVQIGHATLAKVLHADGRTGEALDVLAEAEVLGQRNGLQRLQVAALAKRVRLLAHTGELKAAQSALDAAESLVGAYPTGVLSRWSRRHIMVSQSRAVLQIAQGRPEAALETLMPVLVSAETGGRVQRHVELLVLDVIARSEAGDERGAIRQLRRALSITARTGMVRTYVDEGKRMKRLTMKAWAQWSEGAGAPPFPVPKEHLETVLAALGGEGFETHRLPQRDDAGIAPGELSEREHDVLRSLFAGCSNKQIARQLSVADSTVAWHLKNIYTKLNVNNRTEAVSVAMKHALL